MPEAKTIQIKTGRRERARSSIAFDPDERKTHSEFQDEVNINTIMDRWLKSGRPPTNVNTRTPQWGDFSEAGDFQEALERVELARARFMELPSAVRDACQNDPRIFLDAVNDPEARAHLESLGLGGEAREGTPDSVGASPHPSAEEPEAKPDPEPEIPAPEAPSGAASGSSV